MKNLNDLMKQAQAMQARMAEMQAKLDELEVEGQAGAGLVKVTLSGKGGLKRAAIDPSLLAPGEKEIVEDLLIAAHADAKAKLEHRLQDEMSKVTGGLPLPPGLKLPFG